jgi:hypothetical protein
VGNPEPISVLPDLIVGSKPFRDRNRPVQSLVRTQVPAPEVGRYRLELTFPPVVGCSHLL